MVSFWSLKPNACTQSLESFLITCPFMLALPSKFSVSNTHDVVLSSIVALYYLDFIRHKLITTLYPPYMIRPTWFLRLFLDLRWFQNQLQTCDDPPAIPLASFLVDCPKDMWPSWLKLWLKDIWFPDGDIAIKKKTQKEIEKRDNKKN